MHRRGRILPSARIAAVLIVCGAVLVTANLGVASVRTTDGNDAARPTGLLLAFDVATGKERWRARTPGFFAVEDISNRVVAGRGFPCTGGPFRTEAFAASDGTHLWKGPAANSSPSTRGGASIRGGSTRSGIVVVETRHEIQGRDAQTGSLRWRVPIAWPFPITAAVTSDAVYVPTGNDSQEATGVRALSRKTGETLWTVETGPGFFPPYQLLASSNTVVISLRDYQTDASVTQALNSQDGTARWESDLLPLTVFMNESVVGLEAARGSALVVHDAKSGAHLWGRDSDSRQFVDDLSVGTLALIEQQEIPVQEHQGIQITAQQEITVVEARTGSQLWTAPLAAGSWVAATANNLVLVETYLSTITATITALDARDGQALWTARLPSTARNDHLAELYGTNSIAFSRDTVYVTRGCAPNAE